MFNVKQAYFVVLAARRLLGVADETVQQTRKQLEDSEGRHDVGLAPRFDVTRAQVQLANAELSQLTARNNVSVAGETLRNAMGMVAPRPLHGWPRARSSWPMCWHKRAEKRTGRVTSD